MNDQAHESAAMSHGHPSNNPSIWGLSARDIHRAYWHARGVQPVARDSNEPIDRYAELYLLLEPDELVLFDVRRVIEPMTWNGAVITRLRVVEEDEKRYRERVVRDADGFVDRIERSYRAPAHRSCRAYVTRSRRIARVWSHARSRSVGWRDIRSRLSYYQIEDMRCLGHCYDSEHALDANRLFRTLVQQWADPERSIEGITQVAQGVWAGGRGGSNGDEYQTTVGPAWLGERVDPPACLIGPTVVVDGRLNGERGNLARVRAIGEVELPDVIGNPETVDEIIPVRDRFFSAKRLFDIIVSVCVLLVMLPLLIVVSIAVVIDDGFPIFFGHVRQTRGGRLFKCWKFRTMKRGADAMTDDLLEENQCDGPQFYIENDPRVTRVGRMLRRWHIDELPQFWNVLRGQMSVVGPRPSPDDENQFCPAWRELRLSVRPGITGLWQIERTRRPGMDFQEWIKYDIEYVRRADFWFDMTICIKTFLNIIGWRKRRAAHETG